MAGGGWVRVDPPVVEFNDVKVGQVYQAKVTVTNVGKGLKKIIIEKPVLKSFKFTTAGLAKVVAPGLSISGLLEFTPEEEEEVKDCLLIHVEDVETIEVPLLGFPRVCSLLVDSVLDFGCIAANSQVVSKHHPITNQGAASGVFQVHYSGDSSVRLSPCSGVIAPATTQWIKVEVCTDGPRHIKEKALIKLQNCSTVVLSIMAEVVDQRLEVFDLQGTPLSCLWFGPVYFGTSRMEYVILRNNGPQACDWVSVLQETVTGTEVGTDLQKSTDSALLERMERCIPATEDVSQVLVCVPKQGRLGPNDKATVAVRFSPVCKSTSEKKKCARPASRQDYCLFLLFDSVESRHGFTHPSGNSSVELAVTGSGLPVSLVPSPSRRFDFLTCLTGQRVDLLCVLQNLCPQLPVHFKFRKLAHFTTKPSAGVIAAGQCQDIVLSFTARQQGSFQVRQLLDILGHVMHQSSDSTDVSELEFRSFHTISLHLSAVCCSETKQPVPKLNPGISPAVTNPAGSWPYILSSELELCRGMVRAAVLCADKAQLHTHCKKMNQNTEEEEFLAFPNDRASSIRPASSPTQYRTIFTGVPRYRYVDTSYAFTKEEEEHRQRHRQIYTDFIKHLRQTRLLRIKERKQEEVEDDVDIGIVPCQGLDPPELCISDMDSSKMSEARPKNQYASTGHKCSSPQDVTSVTQQVISQVSGEINAVPTNCQEVADCSRTLTAQELFKVSIGPLLVDFGEVCVQSTCIQKLELINRLSVYVWVQLEVDCPELQGSSPLSHVLPPCSHNILPLTFQSNKLGQFYRPVSYSINQQHPGQILVQAQVVPLALELSTTLLVLSPTPSLLAQSGYRTSVTLRNKRNHAAEFTWRPVVTERGILFSIRPATGTVEPFRELDCEVVWHPSFSSPAEGDFDLCVHEGNTQRLHCIAKVGSTIVQLAEKQITFGSVPLNMPSIRTAVLHNSGQNHAYYQVLDMYPLPGMVVSPSEGVVSSGGQAVLKIHFRPDSVIKFDTRVEIAMRNMKSIELRVGGSVEPPNVDISLSHFQFYGVYAGSRQVIPFTLINHSSAAAWVTFNLSEYPEFCLQLPQSSAGKEPGVSVVEVQGSQTVDCSLVFSPTQAATYDFDLPLMVNGVKWPISSPPSFSPLSSSSTSSRLSAGSTKHMVRLLSHSVTMATQRPRRIQATALCAPLEMSPSSLQFQVEPLAPQSDVYTKTVTLKALFEETVCWRGVTSEHVHWRFDCSAIGPPTHDRRERGLCTVSPSSGSLGPSQSISLTVCIWSEAVKTVTDRLTTLSLPLYLGNSAGEGMGEEEGHQPYRELSITVILQLPNITIHPRQILLTPVPLESSAVGTLILMAAGYPSGTKLSAEVDEVELEDGTKIQPVSVNFLEGNSIPTQDQRHPVGVHNLEASATSLTCSVSFRSAVSLSFCTTITFTDHLHNKFKVKLYATADNCLLTVWPYMAIHRTGQQIVLRSAVEAILQCYRTPSPASGLASSSSSFDHNSSTNKNSASGSFPDSDSVSSQASRNEKISPNRDTPTNHGIPVFPAANSDEELYHQNVLLAVERWFSLFGWPSGPHPISIPHTLRRVVAKVQINHSSARTYRVSQNKDSRSVVDMLHHLTGTQIPGIPCCRNLSSDIDQRTKQLLQQHEAILAFLRVQGASLFHIKPEYLLDVQEFKHWFCFQSDEKKHDLAYRSVDYESLSKRSWTDVLLQIYKVLVLRRVSEKSPKTILNQQKEAVNSQPLASNIYSAWELQLLSWLNTHYQSMRETIWDAGSIPSARWIVNFDLDLTDGLVLAALLAAYCPYLIHSHFRRMYTTTSSLEQILHNNIVVVQALTDLSLNIDIQPTDLSDPNPVQMLMLCVHLYEKLPQYLPQHTVTLSGGLHSTFSKQVRLKNPSSKPLKYQALLLGEDAHRFSLPDGSAVTIPPKTSTEFRVQYSCSFLQPMEAVLLLTSSSAFGLHGAALAFNLKTHVSYITPSNTVKCKSPCYQLRVIHLPVTNSFNKEATFRVVLVESTFNPLEPEKKNDSLVQQASSKANTEKMTSGTTQREDIEEKCSDLNGYDSDFLSAVRTVCLKSGQADTLNIDYLPFCPGTKYCSVLLVCPQVGDMVYILKATAELPLPSPLTARPSSNIVSVPSNSDSPVFVSVLSLSCKVEQVCEAVLQVPLINVAWEQALAIWGQHSMTANERRRRMLTYSLHSSTVRATTAGRKLLKQAQLMRSADQSKVVEYSVEVSLPQYFTLPSTVKIPIEEDTNIPWENPADCGCVDIPLRFQADSVGKFTCQVVLRSWRDTRVYMLEALVTSKGVSIHLDFSAPAHRSVTQDIPLHNETTQDWNMRAEVCGEGFCGPKVFTVAAGTRACYPLTFYPSAQCIVTGKLSLYNSCDGTEHIFTLRGVGEHPLPVDHVVLHCTVGETTHTQLDVPNYSQNKLILKVVSDLSVLSGNPSLEIKPANSALYTLTVTPRKRGKQTGHVSFVDTAEIEEPDKNTGYVLGHYEVYFSLEIICEPAAPVKVIDVECVAQSSVAVEIPVSNPEGELLMLGVYLEGDNLSGASQISVPPRGTLTYKATFSPGKVGKSTGSVVFQSDLVGEVWYQLDLYALPPPVITLPQASCQLGKWTRLTIPLVNPKADTLELMVTNSNPRNYTLEMTSGSALTVEPHSSTQLTVRFSPSSIGEGNHTAKITFTCPQLQEWCVLLSGRGLNPEIEEHLSISSMIGSTASATIPFTNPTELPATLSITLTDEDPTTPDCHPTSTDKNVFSIPLNHFEGIQISEGASFDVPVVFAPESMELQQAWLCITMKPLRHPDNNSNFSTDVLRSEEELSDICWTYPLRGIPMETRVESLPPDVIQCEAGWQLEKKVDVMLSGCVVGNKDRKGQEASQVSIEDFLCEVHLNGKAEQLEVEVCLSATIEAARRDPETGILTLTLNLLYTPLKPCRHSVILAVRCLSGRTWEFPIELIATDAQVDDVINIEAAELGKTSAVGFRLTSTNRTPEPFTAAFVSGSSSEFTMTPASGTLPPLGSSGALITVFFTPTMHNKRHRARLTIQAADVQWTYEVRGKTPLDSPPPVEGNSCVVHPASQQRRNFVLHNLRVPSLANSSPLKVQR
ncbi:cilia- and flagella-associated protein 47 isoform X2 [Anabas testudineus]|uniref:cilia- and flagella-associated protein 47 isoform X2 n=1 Tax=Anabas testudineus TaxID=64144 RepID=UPI000E458CF0|nr:cilia- and flagella-associated protein 47 isoform X2 [Anabas testudineus]